MLGLGVQQTTKEFWDIHRGRSGVELLNMLCILLYTDDKCVTVGVFYDSFLKK